NINMDALIDKNVPHPAPLPEVTERAFARIRHILHEEPRGAMFRVAVHGGGCSGFQYAFDIVAEKNGDDHTLQQDDVTILIDDVSLPFLTGARIDFVDNLLGQSFQVDNPNAVSSCGCGTSFSM